MNELKVFEKEEFGTIRTIETEGKILFCGSDVAKALGYSNASKALNDHCKGVTKCSTLTKGGKQLLSYISEGDVYRLIAHSKLESAQKFESWIFDEVLPSIRKTGSYSTSVDLNKISEQLANNLSILTNLAQNTAIQLQQTNATVSDIDSRLTKIEEQVEQRRVLLPAPQVSPRNHIIQIVKDFALKTNDFQGAWAFLYKEYASRTNTVPSKCAKNRNMKIIDYIESIGQIEVLEAIAIDVFCGLRKIA